MDIDDDDDFYAPEEPDVPSAPITSQSTNAPVEQSQSHHDEGDLEEGEEEDEEGAEMDEDDSDIDIITERKDGTKAPPPTQSKYSDIRNIPQRTTSTNEGASKPTLKKEDSTRSGAELPAVATSKIDVHAIPIHKGTGKPITQVNIDEDLPENDKPWRNPGTDLSDYFNYGFDEFTWAMYAAKQDSVRGEYSQDAIAQNNKKMMEDMQMMMMGGMPGGGGGGMPTMPGMDGMPPEMQQMMQQMMASGMDPSQMDPSAMSAMFAGMQSAGGAGGAQGGQNQNFGGGAQGFGNAQSQQGYGFDQGMGRGGGGGGFGRGRGGRRNW
ncbi:Fip1 motif-domain-containing protein [Xylariales sp. PMI_506]|nr:Fip1 motif-domain-containing protein [Xylariales sp. PMI_506]